MVSGHISLFVHLGIRCLYLLRWHQRLRVYVTFYKHFVNHIKTCINYIKICLLIKLRGLESEILLHRSYVGGKTQNTQYWKLGRHATAALRRYGGWWKCVSEKQYASSPRGLGDPKLCTRTNPGDSLRAGACSVSLSAMPWMFDLCSRVRPVMGAPRTRTSFACPL
jgi:hypothetical protein